LISPFDCGDMRSLLCFDHPSNEVTMKLKIVLEPSDEGGFTAFVPTLPGCISEGENKEDAVKNIREAIDLYLEPVEDDLALSADAEQIELAV
jgi:predicted RNase H-like HicB family nuclease